MYCPNCKCPNCKKEQEGRFCPECGTKLIEKPAGKDGFNISLGDANAISGGVHLADSHAVHNEDNSIHNITNTSSTVTNITNVSAQKTEMELLQERKTLYLNACKRAYEDNVLEQSEKIELDRYRLELGLDEAIADSLLEQVRQMSLRRAQKTELTGIGKIKLKQLTEALKKNEVQAIMRQIDSIEALAGKFANDELQYKYYLVLAALRHEKCIEKFEKSKVDNYWKSFWSYFAYLKAEKPGKASEILYSLSDKFPSYPEDNITLLAAAGSFFKNEKEESHEFLNEVTGDYSPALQRFAETVYLLLEPEMAQEMGATEENCAFYLINFFGQEDPKIKAEKEARRKDEEEARKRAVEEARRKPEQSVVAKCAECGAELRPHQKFCPKCGTTTAEEEARRKAKEEEARKKAEEEARKKAEAAAKRKAEREAKKKAEAAAKRKAEETARKKAEEERKRKAEEEARKPKCSGTTRNYEDHAKALSGLRKHIHENWNGHAREVFILENGKAVALKDYNTFAQIGIDKFENLYAMLFAIAAHTDDPQSIRHFTFNSSEKFCVIYDEELLGDDKWVSSMEYAGIPLPKSMSDTLNRFTSRGDIISSVCIAENDDWAVVSNKAYNGTNSWNTIRRSKKHSIDKSWSYCLLRTRRLL